MVASKSQEINFKRPLKIVHSQTQPRTKLHPKAIKYLNDILNIFTWEMALKFRDTAKGSDKKADQVNVFQNMMKGLFPKEIYRHSYAAAITAANEYENGFLIYKDVGAERERRARMEKAQQLQVVNPYIRGVTSILKALDEFKFETRFKADVATFVNRICNKLVERLAEHPSSNGIVDVVAAKKAVDKIFGPEMAEHANSEGAKYVMLCETGLVTLPQDKRPSTHEGKSKEPKAKKPKLG